MRKYTIEDLQNVLETKGGRALLEALVDNNDCYLGVENDLSELTMSPDFRSEFTAKLRYRSVEQYYDCEPTKEELERSDRLLREWMDAHGY